MSFPATRLLHRLHFSNFLGRQGVLLVLVTRCCAFQTPNLSLGIFVVVSSRKSSHRLDTLIYTLIYILCDILTIILQVRKLLRFTLKDTLSRIFVLKNGERSTSSSGTCYFCMKMNTPGIAAVMITVPRTPLEQISHEKP